MPRGDRCAIYTRVSTQEQERGYSLPAQVMDCRAYAERQGYAVVRVLQESDSGRDPLRTKVQLLLQLAEAGKFDVLVVWRRDRLARNATDAGLFNEVFKANGVRIEGISIGPQQDTALTRFHARIEDAIAELEVDSIAERCQRGRLEAARQGVWPTKPPSGYVRNHPKDDLVIIPEVAAEIRRAYEAVADGANVYEAGRIMSMSHRRACDRLANPAYMGRALYGGIEVPVPAIVSEELWWRVQLELERKRPKSLGPRKNRVSRSPPAVP